ncbi:hypothetical protein AVEN_224214-1 [Araneus ventricosus]|uniref:Uncharacterized protein n=1 Tax=Araneus ventricosus TaxID=182803 RepID=A0A4Y2EG85_ARAVE|nr:hypothetical protein AVEN_224214-1 [Araneus ventricosus]
MSLRYVISGRQPSTTFHFRKESQNNHNTVHSLRGKTLTEVDTGGQANDEPDLGDHFMTNLATLTLTESPVLDTVPFSPIFILYESSWSLDTSCGVGAKSGEAKKLRDT